MGKLPNRKKNRLKEYDYSQLGYYFVTICTESREQIFGTIENNDMILNNVGNMIDQWWQKMFEKYDDISIDKYIIMPNHIHGIINIVGAIPCNRPIPYRYPFYGMHKKDTHAQTVAQQIHSLRERGLK